MKKAKFPLIPLLIKEAMKTELAAGLALDTWFPLIPLLIKEAMITLFKMVES